MDRLGVDFLTGLGMPPVAFVELVADLDCRYISLALGSPGGAAGDPPYDLLGDKSLRRDMRQAMRDNGVSVSCGEGMVVLPGADIRDRMAKLEVMSEFDVPRVNIVSLDPDLGRTFDQYAVGAEMAASFGMEMVTEFAPALSVKNLASALEARRHVGRPDFRLLIDTMHFVRSRGTAADLAALEPGAIGYCQLCDAPLRPEIDDYMTEATQARLAPGDGELPLLALLEQIPDHVLIGLEIPQVALARSGMGHRERIGYSIRKARDFLQMCANFSAEPLA